VLNTWLNYWHNALVDIDRQGLQAKDEKSLSLPSLAKEHLTLATEPLCQFYEKFAPPQAGTSTGQGVREPLDVLIAPFELWFPSSGNYVSAKRKPKILHPFWIPARLTETGQLTPPAGDQVAIPWLVRDVLEPAIASYPVLSTIDKVDKVLATWEWKFESWESYLANAQAFLEKITALPGWLGHATKVGDWPLKAQVTITLARQQGMAANVISLYEHLRKQPALPRLLTTLVQGKAAGPAIDPNSPGILLAKGHYGQMSGAYPLSASQRTTLQLFQGTAPGEIFPVNGPPGTGKTTLLQSIVANLMVEKALLGREAPLILASSANNQAITNILDSFGKDAPLERWLPELSSLGVYLVNYKGKEAQEHGYQVEGREANFYQPKEADGNYLCQAQAELVRQGARFFGRPYARVELLRDDLHATLKVQVGHIAAWLDLLPRLRDHAGQPWNRTTLHAQQQALNARIKQLEDFQLAVIRLQAAESGTNKVLGWLLPAVRQSQQAKYLLLVREQCPYREEVTDYDPTALSAGVQPYLDAARHQLQQCLTGLANLAEFDKLQLQFRQDHAANNAALKLLDLVTPDDFARLHDALDISYRYRAFLLALHYWEARYVLALREKLQAPAQRYPRHETPTAEYARWGMLTPCFISTFHTVAGFLDNNKNKHNTREKAYALELFDLLLVDEAGQVSPEIGVPAFALAKKAIVVGDTRQIQPVWSMVPALDDQNLRRVGLDPDWQPEAYRTSAGSIMLMAQLASAIQLSRYDGAPGPRPERGLLLRQHRRCKPEIINYCDRFVYDRQLERIPIPPERLVFSALNLPSLGYIHINGECTSEGGSKQNLSEAAAIARWVAHKREEILRVAQEHAALNGQKAPALKDIIGILTPFSSQKNAIKQALQTIGLGGETLTVGTVHALQGAERAIVLFSPVYDTNHTDPYFFDKGYNLLNVAVSRAKEVFLVVGNRCLFNPAYNTPSGNLAKLLFEEPTAENQLAPEIDNSFFYGQEQQRHLLVPHEFSAVTLGRIKRIDNLTLHRRVLTMAFGAAKAHLVIVSPFISLRAVLDDDLPALIAAAKAQQPNLRITVYTDAHLDAPGGQLHVRARDGRAALTRAGAQVKIVEQIHNKTICIDNDVLIEGSFNWLSASRSEVQSRHEVSWSFRGEACAALIQDLTRKMETRLLSESPVGVG
jgi:hypothetical protein